MTPIGSGKKKNPTTGTGMLALFKGVGEEAVEVYKNSEGKLVVNCEIEISGKFLTDKNGELVAMIEAGAGGPVTDLVLDAKAKTSNRWSRKKVLDWDGEIKITWKLHGNNRKTTEQTFPISGNTLKQTEEPA